MFLDYIITKSWITECSCLITTIITSNPISRLSCMPESTIKRELYKAFDITFGFGTITVALSFTFETQLTTVATFLNRSIYTRSIIWGADSWQRTKNTLITCYFEWYWNSSRLIVRFIFLLIKTENTDAFSEKTKKKCYIIKKGFVSRARKICFNQSEALPRSRSRRVIKMEFLRSFPQSDVISRGKYRLFSQDISQETFILLKRMQKYAFTISRKG